MANKPRSIAESLQAEDIRLSREATEKPYAELAERVAQFIGACVRAGENVLDVQDRRIVRSIIQYWATYQYKHTGHYCLPNLAKATAAFSKMTASREKTALNPDSQGADG